MGRKSSADRLDPEIKAYITAMLATGSQTLNELIADLKERYPAAADSGELPSRSALGRYGQKLDRKLAAVRAGTEAALLIHKHAGDTNDARSGALVTIVQTELIEAMMSLQDANDPDIDQAERIGLLSAAAKNIATLVRSSVFLKRFQAEAEEAARKKILAEQSAALKAMGVKGGVSPETMLEIRTALGIT